MSTVKRIAKNTSILLLSQIIGTIMGFVYVMYMARYLGASGFGMLSFALSFTGIISIISDLGLAQLTTREVARNPALSRKYISNVTAIKVILSLITLFVTAISINLLGYPKETILVVYIFGFYSIINAISLQLYSIFRAHERMEYQSISQVINSFLMLIGIIFAINNNLDVIGFASIYLLASIIILLFNFLQIVAKFGKIKLEFDQNFWRQNLKESIPFWLSSVFSYIYYRISMIMLSMMKGDIVVGWYAAPYRLIDALSFIPAAITTSIFPVFSKFHGKSTDSLKLTFRKSFSYLFFIAFPIAVGTTLLADKIIISIFNEGYSASIIALKILSWASFLSFINWIPATLMGSINKQKQLMKITLVGSIGNILLNLLLIPNFSYIGASISIVITELFIGFAVLGSVQESLGESPINKSIIKSIIAGFIMGFILIFVLKEQQIYVSIPISVVVYISTLYLIGGLNREDTFLLKQVLKRG